jgi:MFS superfamily sulfate permease-like transporter
VSPLAAVAIPETMGYTSIAQTPIVTGLYTVIFPTLLFALLGSSRLLVVGADSATAAILAAGLATVMRGRADAELRTVAGVHVLHRAAVRRDAAHRPGGTAGIPR